MDCQTIYFDFDRTLLDTDALKAEQERRIAQITELSIEQVNEGMRHYIASLDTHLHFPPEGYAAFLANRFSIDQNQVLKVYITDSNYIAEYLFPEVLEVLAELKNRGVELGVFSGAMFGHQKVKIERSGITEFISWKSILVTPQKLDSQVLSKIPRNALVIDDDIAVVTALVTQAPTLVPVWCNRKTSDQATGLKTIHSLKDLI